MTEFESRTPMPEIDPRRVAELGQITREEAGVILSLYPDATARQWSASPVPRPREDTPQRSSGGRPSDPTADAVLDARRLEVREAVVTAERSLHLAALALRSARRTMERAIARFDGEATA